MLNPQGHTGFRLRGVVLPASEPFTRSPALPPGNRDLAGAHHWQSSRVNLLGPWFRVLESRREVMENDRGVISHSFMVLRSLGPDCEIGYDGDDHTVSGRLPLLRNQAHHGPNYVEPNLPPRIDSCTE